MESPNDEFKSGNTSQIDSLIKKNFQKISAALEERKEGKLNHKPSHSSELTTGSDNFYNKGDFSVEAKKSGVRSSIMSDYSGIIHQVDIDTIKYVNAETETQIPKSSSSKSISKSFGDEDIPLRSSRRPSYTIDSAKINRMTSTPLLKHQNSVSPRKSSPPPKSPLPAVKTGNYNSSPRKLSRSSSRSSTKSLTLNVKLDELIKEATILKHSVDTSHKKLSLSGASILVDPKRQSFSSTGGESFHTADDNESDIILESGSDNQHEEFKLGYQDEYEGDQSWSRSDRDARAKSISTLKAPDAKEGEEYAKPKRRHSKSSHKHHRHHHRKSSRRQSGQSTSSSKRHSTGSSVKPFSYDTLSRLLNATDGIVIGQEFSSLNIPMEEKFLIERVVDSISRLTANMVLNPVRYDQSLTRLEKVLNVLEGFE